LLEKDKKQGLAKINAAEWGYIDPKEIEDLSKDESLPPCKRPVPIFKDYLPCTLKELSENILLWTYFPDE
jgi:hypothetical protein